MDERTSLLGDEPLADYRQRSSPSDQRIEFTA